MVGLYLDEDSMDSALVSGLRANGLDVLTTYDAGRLRRSDFDQLDYATSLGRVIYTGKRWRLSAAPHDRGRSGGDCCEDEPADAGGWPTSESRVSRIAALEGMP